MKMLRLSTNKIIPILVFLSTAALYIRTTAPTLGGAFDSEEFQYVAYTLGIAHATGYPLYLLLGKIFITLVPIGNVAYRMNLLSALIGAGAVTLIYAITFRLTRRHIASIATAAIFATNAAVWRQSGVASVGPLTIFFMAAVTFAALLWEERKFSTALIAFVFGLALTHHHSVLFFLPGLAAFVLIEDFKILTRPRELFRIVIWFLIPLLLYLYIPARGSVSEWYNNSLESFSTQVVGTTAGDFLRTSPLELLEAAATLFSYFYSSFTLIGALIVILGAISILPRFNRWQTALADEKAGLMFGIGTCAFVGIGLFYGGEPDRYVSLPFFFIVFWFGIGAAFLQNQVEARWFDFAHHRFKTRARLAAQIAFAILVTLPIVFTFHDNFKYADWSAFDRTYKQWDEIFSLPVPANATIVGNWGQLNAMRYMQFVENRRRDILPIGTLYDVTLQTNAAHEAFAQNRTIFLAPGIAQPTGTYRYALLGPMLEVRDAPQTQPFLESKNIAISQSLTLFGFSISTALEPYAPTTNITPTPSARVWLEWRADGAVPDFRARIRLYDPEVRVIAQIEEPPVRGLYPASQWSRGEYVRDVHNFLIPGGTPPGKYKITLTAFDKEVELGSVSVDRITTLGRDQVFVAHPLEIALNDRIALLGYGGFEGVHRASETITFNALWSARENAGGDADVFIALVDANGKKVWETRRAFIAYHPAREWQRGELLKAYYDVKLPDDARGELSLMLGLDEQQMRTVGKLQIAP